tara:strand:- start:26 stop:286 length:261 start_codon:yes stop_codon:yes gene_type:complete
MLDFKIDKGVSLDNFKFQKWTHIVDEMEVGDSVFFKKTDYAKKRNFYEAISYRGYKPVSRIDSDPFHGEGYRVWKLEKQEVSNESL